MCPQSQIYKMKYIQSSVTFASPPTLSSLSLPLFFKIKFFV